MKKRCSLCGGKLRNYRCIDCGLDNSKNDDMYIKMRRECDREPLTHTHKQTDSTTSGKLLRKETPKKTYTSDERSPGNNSKKVLQITLIICILGVILPGIFSIISSIANELKYEFIDTIESTTTEEDPYEYVQRELSTIGEHQTLTFDAGTYKGGIHIPEGNYKIQAINGEGRFSLEDYENSIYLSYAFDANNEYGPSEQDDIRVYDGALLIIKDKVTLTFTTETAQPLRQMIANPLTDTFVIDDSFTAGLEIPAGVYDITCTEGSGNLEYTVQLDDFEQWNGFLIGDDTSSFPNTLKNIVIPEGTNVTLEGVTLMLTPSEWIESEDYLSFY